MRGGRRPGDCANWLGECSCRDLAAGVVVSAGSCPIGSEQACCCCCIPYFPCFCCNWLWRKSFDGSLLWRSCHPVWWEKIRTLQGFWLCPGKPSFAGTISTDFCISPHTCKAGAGITFCCMLNEGTFAVVATTSIFCSCCIRFQLSTTGPWNCGYWNPCCFGPLSILTGLCCHCCWPFKLSFTSSSDRKPSRFLFPCYHQTQM